MRIIRSSEIGSYLYCHRAWWYAKNGEKSENQTEMKAGTKMHEEHGQRVFWGVGLMRIFAVILSLISLLMMLWLYIR